MTDALSAEFYATLIQQIIGAAESSVGVSYAWGGNSLASGVDCSGLVQQAFRAGGINLPRVSADQARAGTAVASLGQAMAGDLLWWDNSTRNDGADHIAIYIGNGMMIEAAHAGTAVRVVPVRTGARISRVIGVVPNGDPQPVTLGGNTSRSYTNAAVTGFKIPPPTDNPTAASSPELMTASAVKGAAMPADVLTPQSSPAVIEAYIKKTYPEWAPFLANDEIKNVLLRYDIEDMDDTEIEALLRNTTYWQTHGAPSRAFDALIGTDGQAAGNLVDNVMGMLGDKFAQMGLNATSEQLGIVAKNAIRAGWIDLNGNVINQGKLADFIGFALRNQMAGSDGKIPAGEVQAGVDELRQIARAYFIPMTEKDLADWTLRITEGTATKETFTSYITTLAKGRFSNDKDVLAAIDGGLSPDQFFAPIRNTIAQTLELNPQSVDFNDPKYMQLVGYHDPNTGTTRSMTLYEAAQWARNQPGYSNTDAYRQQDADFTLKMAQTFGGIA